MLKTPTPSSLIKLMKTVFDKPTREDVIRRIESLSENHLAQWGKMNVHQMTRHCIIWDEWVQGKYKPVYKQALIGKIFGKRVLKNHTKDERPLPKNMPAGKAFEVKEADGDLARQKQDWIELIKAYENYSNPGFIHDFYGKMTLEQIGILAYKHADHHMRQFNV